MDYFAAFFNFVLFTLASSAHKELENSFKQTRKDNGKIIGGKDTDIKNVPYIVSLQDSATGQHFCGGSIISSEYILTAAHCVTQDKLPAERIQIVAGTTNLKRETEQTQKRRVRSVIRHPKFSTKTRDSDVALIRLATPLDLQGSRPVKAVELDRKEFTSPDSLVLTGWGLTSENNKETSDHLKTTVTPGISRAICRRRYKSSRTTFITNNMICAGTNGTDGCRGDSGGPAISQNTKKQAGIISWGRGCAGSYPGVHANVARFIPWIRRETGLAI